MEQNDTQEMRYRLAIQQGIDRQMNTLIVDVRGLLDEFMKGHGGWNMDSTQMSNLLNVCSETESVEVIVSFLHYQIGRDDRHKNTWAWRGFGEELVEKLSGLRSKAKALVNRASQEAEYQLGKSEAQQQDHVWVLLARQYVGHLRRYFTYKNT
jgi:hypothetical protein